jgi:glycosyltransferase involved in cell wall biosynthesis
MSLKILHINFYDKIGGAAIAVDRIHNSFLNNKIDSKILVANKTSTDSKVIGPSSTLEEIFWKIRISINRKIEKFEKKKIYDSNSYNLIKNNFVKKINQIDCDIVNLHWIGNNLISINDIKKINKPIVWTMHDMWPYTGSEHYTFSKRYIKGYTKENKPEEIKGFDIERYCWEQKKKHYPKNISIVATSTWQLNNVKNSLIFKENFVEKIFYPIDFDEWRPYDKITSRNSLNLPLDKRIIVCGSENLDIPRKGFDKLMKATKNPKFKKDLLIIFFGDNKKTIPEGIQYKHFGKIDNKSLDMKFIYSASDLMVAPSLQESFGQTILEASCCGIPSVCFEDTGFCDVVSHKNNGYVAKLDTEDDLIEGVNWCLDNWSKDFAQKNINTLKDKFSNEIISQKYLNLYRNILNL